MIILFDYLFIMKVNMDNFKILNAKDHLYHIKIFVSMCRIMGGTSCGSEEIGLLKVSVFTIIKIRLKIKLDWLKTENVINIKMII